MKKKRCVVKILFLILLASLSYGGIFEARIRAKLAETMEHKVINIPEVFKRDIYYAERFEYNFKENKLVIYDAEIEVYVRKVEDEKVWPPASWVVTRNPIYPEGSLKIQYDHKGRR